MQRDRIALIAAVAVFVAFAIRWTTIMIAIEMFGYVQRHVLSATLAGKIVNSLMAVGFLVWGGFVLAKRAPPLPFTITAVVIGVIQWINVFDLRFGTWPLAISAVAELVMAVGAIVALIALILEFRAPAAAEV